MAEVTTGAERLMQLAWEFWPSKLLLTAVELEVFTKLSASSMTGEELGPAMGLHPQASGDFFDEK